MSAAPRRRPPALASRLLASAVRDDEWREMVLGDLHEEHQQRLARQTPSAAALWYWMEAIRLSSRYATVAALRRGPRRDRVGDDPPPPGDSAMRRLATDAKYALRTLRQRRGFTAIVVLTLSCCVGANAAVFAMIDALLLRPFTFHHLERLTVLGEPLQTEQSIRRGTVAPADFLDWQRQSEAFERLVAFNWWDVNLVGHDEPERVQGFRVSSEFFATLGVEAALGRGFVDGDDAVGHDRSAVIGYGLWRRRFGGDPRIVGQTLALDGQPYEIVGVAPQGFDFPMGAELWAPLSFDAKTAALRSSHYLTVIGRLAPGRTLDDARAQMAVLGQRLAAQHPDTNKGRVLHVYSFGEGMLDTALRPILSLWQASAGFVLLIGCANIANLLLALGATRQRDLAVRLAMGASRARIVGELLAESVMLAVMAIPLAIGLAWASLTTLRGVMPAKVIRFVPGWSTIDVDARLVVVTAIFAVATAIVFGLLPALQASRPNLAEVLKDGSRGATAGRQRARRALVVAEMTLTLPLLVASGMAATGAYQWVSGPQGYDPDRVLSLQTVLPDPAYGSPAARRRFVDGTLTRVTQLPGVDAAAVVNIMPSAGGNDTAPVEIEGEPPVEAAARPTVDWRSATPDLFATLGVPLLSGRQFTTGDRDGSQPVAIVSQSLARRYWPGQDPIGRRLRLSSDTWITVVGVCGDVIHDWFNRRNYPTVYRPYHQSPTDAFALLLRTSGDPAGLAAQARAAVRAVDPNQPVFDVMTVREAVSDRTVGLRYIAAVMGVFGVLALVLAVVGIYSVMAYFIAQRTQEIGVRIALGASRADVLRLTIRQAGRLTAIGLAIGAVVSLALGRLVEAGLVGTAVGDVRMLAGFALVLGAAGLIAGYLPARRAASIDPVTALRG